LIFKKIKLIIKKTLTCFKKIIYKVVYILFKDKMTVRYFYSIIEAKALSLPPEDSLKFLFELDNRLYSLQGKEAVRYGSGIHTKHRHIKYHDFFIKHIPEGKRVLDVGCGNGALAFDIATEVPGVFLYGIDIAYKNIEEAQREFSRENLKFVCGDALKDLPAEKFHIIVLSNVLEHIEKRVEFLITLKKRYNPEKFLLRVPLFDRDWRVPLKKEIGIDYRLDSTHYIEYLEEEFFEELEKAGLKSNYYKINWGEIWVEAIPV